MVSSIGLLLVRLAAGGLMAYYHGWNKLSTFSATVEEFPDPLGIGSKWSLVGAVGAEFFCAILIVLGLMTRWVSFGIVFTMAIAAVLVHQMILADIELALIYLLISLALMFTGAGRLSLDALIYHGGGK